MNSKENRIHNLVDHLFRHESGKMVGVLTKLFGVENMELAEDVVQDSLIEAMEHWQFEGPPERPAAWIYCVAKNKALNVLNREKYRKKYYSDAAYQLRSTQGKEPDTNILFSGQEIRDDQLRMMFTCCHPSISPDSQIALALKTLCGFGIPEIAKAYLTTEETINKRLVRARQKIRENKIPFEVPGSKNLEERVDTVLETLYLLFNEGYSASRGSDIIRYELCEEAIRLSEIIVSHPAIANKGKIAALLSLMYLNASRFKARQDNETNLLTLAEQDRRIWDRKMIDQGLHWLAEATKTNIVSNYHILAAISAHYCLASDFTSTDWKSILALYDHLTQLDHSPLVILNRSIALFKVSGAREALDSLGEVETDPVLKSYHLFYSTRAEFYMQLELFEDALKSLETAMTMSPVYAEKAYLQRKINACHDYINAKQNNS